MLRDDLLTMLSIKGFARADGLTDALGIARGDVDAELANLGKLGLADESKAGWRLSVDGKDAARNVAEHERAGLDGALMEDAYACFVAANDRFKATIVRWQMRDLAGASVPNDHSDAAYDASVVDEIRSVHAEIVALLDRLAEHVRRAATYRARFERALERIARGERRFVAAPIVESYHTIWFELHEDLIRLSGRNRHDEAAAGRGA